jgi:hypothetical protein
MNSLVNEVQSVAVEVVEANQTELKVRLSDGRTIAVPIAWYPRLSHATADELRNWRLIGDGRGIHWEDLDEDISVENLVSGKASAESQASFQRWLEARGNRNATVRLDFPVFTIGQSATDAIIVDILGTDCVLLFNKNELAELYIEQATAAGSPPLVTIEFNTPTSLQVFLQLMSQQKVEGTVWDATLRPQIFKIVLIKQLLQADAFTA